MPPASRNRQGTTGEKGSEKAQGREWKASSKHASIGAGMAASAYNPGTGMFHSLLDSSISETMVSNQNGRFKSIDDSDDVGSIIGSYSEYDSMSNNGSCSGESEDQLQNLNGKDKKGQPPGVVGGGSDKRDKIRFKNEKKHQRQKERRAHELRDRCTGYLMSRKLEALAQQLVAMGFSHDRATMALIFNEGHVEHSVAWLLEGGEGQVKEDWNAERSLKIDIADELARIADLEIRFKYLRVEIERAVVACEGDLDKAANWLRERHPQPRGVPEYGSSPSSQDRGKEQPTSATTTSPYLLNAQGRASGLFQALNHERQQERELHTLQGRPQGYQAILSRSPGSVDGSLSTVRSGPQMGTDWPRVPPGMDGKVVSNGMRNPSQAVHLSYPSPGRHSLESRAPQHEKGLPSRREQGLLLTRRDPIVSPQLPQSPITPPSNVRSASVSPSLSPSSWNGSVVGASSPSSVLFFNGTAGDVLFKGASNAKSTGATYSKHAEDPVKAHPSPPNRSDVQASAWGIGSNSFGARDNARPSASVPASTSHLRSQSAPRFLSGWGSGLPGGPADWSMWVSSGCDYKNIDWSMGASPSSTSEPSVWGVSSSFSSVLNLSEGGNPRLGLAGEGISQTYTGDGEEARSSLDYLSWTSSNRGNSGVLGLQDKPVSDGGSAAGVGVPEWTSPFAGKDLFTLPHQGVPSPLL
ncbi:unnamed protein product [Calypogeia fissa]